MACLILQGHRAAVLDFTIGQTAPPVPGLAHLAQPARISPASPALTAEIPRTNQPHKVQEEGWAGVAAGCGRQGREGPGLRPHLLCAPGPAALQAVGPAQAHLPPRGWARAPEAQNLTQLEWLGQAGRTPPPRTELPLRYPLFSSPPPTPPSPGASLPTSRVAQDGGLPSGRRVWHGTV